MRNIRVRTIIYALLVLLIALSGYLTYSNAIGNEEGVCIVDPGHANGCSDVQNGPYGSLFGMKLCHWGLMSFTALLVIYIIGSTRNRFHKIAHSLFVFLSLVGAFVAAYFLIIQFFVLKTLCSTCIIIDLAAIFVFLLSYLEFHKKKRK